MAGNDQTKEAEKDRLVENLLSQPARSLEARIRELDSEIRDRRRLSSEMLGRLGTREIELRAQLHRMRYVSMFELAFQAKRDFEAHLTRIQEQKNRELVSSFLDLARLAEKLGYARAEHCLEFQKLSLISDKDDNDTD